MTVLLFSAFLMLLMGLLDIPMNELFQTKAILALTSAALSASVGIFSIVHSDILNTNGKPRKALIFLGLGLVTIAMTIYRIWQLLS